MRKGTSNFSLHLEDELDCLASKKGYKLEREAIQPLAHFLTMTGSSTFSEKHQVTAELAGSFALIYLAMEVRVWALWVDAYLLALWRRKLVRLANRRGEVVLLSMVFHNPGNLCNSLAFWEILSPEKSRPSFGLPPPS